MQQKGTEGQNKSYKKAQQDHEEQGSKQQFPMDYEMKKAY